MPPVKVLKMLAVLLEANPLLEQFLCPEPQATRQPRRRLKKRKLIRRETPEQKLLRRIRHQPDHHHHKGDTP